MWVCGVWGALQTALFLASQGGHVEAIRELKNAGFKAFDAQNENGSVSMMECVIVWGWGQCGGCEGAQEGHD